MPSVLLQLQLRQQLNDTTAQPFFGAGVRMGAPSLSLAVAAASGEPLTRAAYAADPCARVFDGTLWVYVSHDADEPHETRTPSGTLATDMSIADLHVYSTAGQRSPLRPRRG